MFAGLSSSLVRLLSFARPGGAPRSLLVLAAPSVSASSALLLSAFSALLLSASNAVAQPSIPCSSIPQVQESCGIISNSSNCSRALIDTCCRCQAEWAQTFEFCSFQVNYFVTPTPTPTPVITPTPQPGQQFNCRVTLIDFSTECSQGRYSGVVALERGAIPAGDTLRTTLQCNDVAQRLSPAIMGATTSGTDPRLPPFTANGFGVLSMREPPLGAEAICVVQVASVSSSGTVRSGGCEYAVGVRPCALECDSRDNLDTQVAVDSGVTRLFALLKAQAKALTMVRKRSTTEARKAVAQGQRFFEQGWRTTYQYPRVTQSCSNTTQCVEATLADLRAPIVVAARGLRDLSLQMNSRVAKFSPQSRRKKIRAQRERAIALYKTTMEELEQLPATRSVCGAGV